MIKRTLNVYTYKKPKNTKCAPAHMRQKDKI